MFKQLVIAAAVAFAVGFGLGAYWQNTLRALDAASVTAATATGIANAHTATAQTGQVINAIETNLVKEMGDDSHETDNLRAGVDSGVVSLRVNATCAPVPDAAASTGVSHGAGARLTPEAQSAYYAVRTGIQRCQKKLAAAQAILKEERRVRVDR